MNFRRITLLFWMVFVVTPLLSLPCFAEEDPIRVAFVKDEGFHTMEVNGGYSGFNYDYLMKVAQYTGWTYEFVEIQSVGPVSGQVIAENMVEMGDIDLLGSIYLTPENAQRFEFGDKNYGVSRYILCTLENNNTITANTFFLQEKLSVALVKGDTKAEAAFHRIMQNIQMEEEVVYVDTQAEALALLQEGTVDTIMELDVSFNSSLLSTLTTLSPTPFYFVSTKGNTDLLAQLDEAITNIEKGEYIIQEQLLDKYFGLLHTGDVVLTKEEQIALADHPYLTIGLLKGREPYQFYQEGDGVPHGISVEILEEISRIIGVEFRYVWLDSREEMRDKIASEEIDLCSTVPFDSDYDLTYFFDVVLTQPYLTNAVSWLHPGAEKEGIPPHYYYLADNIPLFPDDQLTEVFQLEATLKEISEDGSLSLFADPYMAQYHLQKLGINNIELQSISSIESKICFGVGKHLDSAVVGLLNHAILHLDPFVVDEIIYRNVTVQGTITLEAFFEEYTAQILAYFVVFLMVILLAVGYHGRKFRKMAREDSLTKLFNAGYFHNYAEETTCKIQNGCLILVDIDFFKQVNDTHGHQAGDKVIQAVGNQLKEHFTGKSVVARLGGDEFVILMEYDCPKESLEAFSQATLAKLSSATDHVPVSLSIGGYSFHQAREYEELYRLADEVLYQVKENGRNGYLFR